jgi:GNAT superfamily N-acetyltransferase
VRILRVTAQNAWRLQQIERTPDASSWVREAEDFLLDGRAFRHLRNSGTIMLAAEAGTVIGAAIAYTDPTYQHTARLGSMVIDHRHRRQQVGATLFGALLTAALRNESYAIWLVHADNEPMLRLSRSHSAVRDEAPTRDGYIQFFAER